MAIVWGAAVSDSSNAFRVGYEISQSPATVSNSTTSVTITLKIYLQTKYYAYDSGANWFISGDIAASGSTSFNHGSSTAWSSSNITLMATRTKTVTPSFSSTVVTNGAASVSGLAAIAGSASVSWSITTAKRPVGVPASPTGASVARVSDTQHTVSWTNTSPTSSSNPYTNVVVERSTNGGAFAAIATVGVVSSYSDKTTVANRRYAYRVRAKNTAGYSGYSNTTSTLYTTPATPPAVTATKTAGGDIVLTWANTTSSLQAIEVWHAANGVWDGAALTTSLGATATTYTHTAPSASVTHKYRLRYRTTSPALNSAYGADSNTVQLQGPPNAPTNLTPADPAIDAAEALAVSWQHNPIDTTPQRKYQLQWRANAGAWNVGAIVTSSTSAATFAANTFANGTVVDWQVRTWGSATTGGADGTGASAWSASRTYTASARPTATLSVPDGTTYAQAVMTAVWAYFDAEGTPQAAWQAQLLDSGGSVLEDRTGAGEDGQVTFNTRLADATTYQVRVRVQDGSGLWSTWTATSFPVAYAKPPVPTALLEWNPEDLSISVVIDNPPEVAPEIAAVTNDVYRRIDGGPWVLVATGITADSSAVDYIPALAGVNEYKVVAYSAIPSSRESTVYAAPQPPLVAMALNAGPGFGIGITLPYDPDASFTYSRDKVVHKFAGRTYGVPFTGEGREESLTLSASVDRQLPDTPDWEAFKLLCDAGAELACYRDPDGRRMFVSLGAPGWAGAAQRGQAKVSVQAERVAYTEGTVDSSGLTLAMGLYIDEDGVPYFDPGRRSIVALDDDGQPYVVIGE